MAQSAPSSLVISTSQIQVVRPRWRGVASAWMVPLEIGAQEVRVVGLADRDVARVPDAEVGADRGDGLADRAEDPAVDDAEGLHDLGRDRDLRAHAVGAGFEELEAVELVEDDGALFLSHTAGKCRTERPAGAVSA